MTEDKDETDKIGCLIVTCFVLWTLLVGICSFIAGTVYVKS